jgi:hypothetical protein
MLNIETAANPNLDFYFPLKRLLNRQPSFETHTADIATSADHALHICTYIFDRTSIFREEDQILRVLVIDELWQYRPQRPIPLSGGLLC